jgi:AraC-like DNA-binding protein
MYQLNNYKFAQKNAHCSVIILARLLPSHLLLLNVMNYQTFQPRPDLDAVIKCHWTLEVPAEKNSPKQRIVPDGCIEMIFILGDDIKRYTSEDQYILQPRAMVLGQITEPFIVEPTGYVNSFAVRFYPYGFANFVTTQIKNLANSETPISVLFGDKPANDLEHKIISAPDTKQRIEIVENFLLHRLKDRTTIDNIVKATVETILQTEGGESIHSILKDQLSKRRQLERKFFNQVGISPKQLGKIIRLQTALKMMLNQQYESFTKIAYESKYYDQAHFTKDFKEFTGTNPKDFLGDKELLLSTLFYCEE